MRSVFIVSLGDGYGGAERSIEIIANRLQQDVRIIVFASSSKHVAALRSILCPPSRLIVFRCGDGTMNWFSWVAMFLVFLTVFRPNAIITNTNLSAELLAATARVMPEISRRAFIFVRDFAWRDLDRIFQRLDKARVLIPGPALLDRPDYIARHLAPVGPMQWSIVGNAMNLPGHAPPPDESDGYVLHLASSNLWKGHYQLIRAAALLRDSGVPMRFISRGGVHNRELWLAFHRIISRWKLGGLFALWDAVDDPSELLHRSLCVVVPSISHFGGPETFGRAIIEAWAHRKPVVAFDVGGGHYLIEHEKDGLLVPEGNVAQLADALRSLRQDPDLCRRLGEAGLAKGWMALYPTKLYNVGPSETGGFPSAPLAFDSSPLPSS